MILEASARKEEMVLGWENTFMHWFFPYRGGLRGATTKKTRIY
jgi:hypothetical protein